VIKLLILDRDGVLNKVVMRGKIKSSPRNLEELKMPNDFKTIQSILKEINLKIVVATNQPDLSRNLLDFETHKEIIRLVSQNYDIPINNFFVCPHDDYHNCYCRKPKPGMIIEALKRFKINPNEAVMIGDSLKDIQAASSAKVENQFFISSEKNIKLKLKKENPKLEVFNSTSKALLFLMENL
tara:strand:+ start:1323 stop:1871 length:549 start_codon:yes stop_codon:yes gene_type:complete